MAEQKESRQAQDHGQGIGIRRGQAFRNAVCGGKMLTFRPAQLAS